MRRIAVLTGIGCVLAACSSQGAGPDVDATAPTAPSQSTSTSTTAVEGPTSTTGGSAPPSTSTTSTAAPTTTRTTTTTAGSTSTTGDLPFDTFAVPVADHCVIDTRSTDYLNVREGPGTDYESISRLAHDSTGVHTTGVGARDDDDRLWVQIEDGLSTAWVASWYLTPGPCTAGTAVTACVVDTDCTERLNVRTGPGVEFARLGSLPFDAVGVAATGVTAEDADGRTWWQIEFRGDLGWAASWYLAPGPCTASTGQPCLLPSGPPSPDCENGWTTPFPGSSDWTEALAAIGAYGPDAHTEPDAFVVDEIRYCVGPEDADIGAPRPQVERWYVEGYSEVDADYRGRWIVRRTGVGSGLAWVAPYESTGFGPGIWEGCPDGCAVGRPLAGEWCQPGCGDDPFFRPCTGVAPGTWSAGDCSGLPPEVLGCLTAP